MKRSSFALGKQCLMLIGPVCQQHATAGWNLEGTAGVLIEKSRAKNTEADTRAVNARA
jgi:hypothetical protein